MKQILGKLRFRLFCNCSDPEQLRAKILSPAVTGFLLAALGIFSHSWLKTPRGILSAEELYCFFLKTLLQ